MKKETKVYTVLTHDEALRKLFEEETKDIRIPLKAYDGVNETKSTGVKKETKKILNKIKKDKQGLSDYILNGYKVPKGFKEFIDFNFYKNTNGIIEANEFNIIAIPKLIFDKRMMMITKYILEAEYRYWSVKDTNHIRKIIDGGYDD